MLLALVALLLACAPSTGKPEPSGEDPVVPEAAAASSSEPIDPSFEIVKKICASPCSGPHAMLVMFRRDSGELGVVRFEGDLQSCSHPPWLYFDPKGNEILAIPEEPVVPGSAEAEAFAAKQAAVVAGMKEAERFWCPDAPSCDVRRRAGPRRKAACGPDSGVGDVTMLRPGAPVDTSGGTQRSSARCPGYAEEWVRLSGLRHRSVSNVRSSSGLTGLTRW